MALKPLEKGRDGVSRPRQTNEQERGRLRQQQDKKDFYRRNPDKKWGDR
jgi:hypothetical protein